MNELVRKDSITSFQASLGYTFKDPKLLIQALSHPSLKQHASQNNIIIDNERFELLGDSVIGFVITELIFKSFTDYSEGKLAIVKSHLVCKEMLCQIATKVGLAEHIIMTHGEEASGGRENPNNLENAFEALIGAIYLDSSIEDVKAIIKELWKDFLVNPDLTKSDPKSALQELVQGKSHLKPIYEVISKNGSAHSPVFTVQVTVQDHKAVALGHSIKAAQKEAAKIMLSVLKSDQ